MKSLSDLNGTDVYIHRGRLHGVFAQLGNAFLRTAPRPSVPQMQAIYRALRGSVPGVLQETGSNTLFEARPFQELSAIAVGLTDEVVSGRTGSCRQPQHQQSLSCGSGFHLVVPSLIHQTETAPAVTDLLAKEHDL